MIQIIVNTCNLHHAQGSCNRLLHVYVHIRRMLFYQFVRSSVTASKWVTDYEIIVLRVRIPWTSVWDNFLWSDCANLLAWTIKKSKIVLPHLTTIKLTIQNIRTDDLIQLIGAIWRILNAISKGLKSITYSVTPKWTNFPQFSCHKVEHKISKFCIP